MEYRFNAVLKFSLAEPHGCILKVLFNSYSTTDHFSFCFAKVVTKALKVASQSNSGKATFQVTGVKKHFAKQVNMQTKTFGWIAVDSSAGMGHRERERDREQSRSQ